MLAICLRQDFGGNAGVGVNALQSNTNGGGNTAIGGYALESNTAGLANAAIGFGALSNNTTGHDNTAVDVGAQVGSGDWPPKLHGMRILVDRRVIGFPSTPVRSLKRTSQTSKSGRCTSL